MKKLSSMLALGMALALTFGMTVSAAGSVTTQDPDFKPTEDQINQAEDVIADAKADVKAPEGVEIKTSEIKAETVAEIMTTDVANDTLQAIPDEEWGVAVDKMLSNMGKEIGSGVSVSLVNPETGKAYPPVAAVEIECENIPVGGLTVEIANANIQPNDTTTYVVMHLNSETGLWEIIVPDKVENGKVIVTFDSLSPATVQPTVIVPLKEEDPTPDTPTPEVPKQEPEKEEWPEPRHPETAAANPATSPKTAETLPLAGVMALIGLAGAAICASKIRYNK